MQVKGSLNMSRDTNFFSGTKTNRSIAITMLLKRWMKKSSNPYSLYKGFYKIFKCVSCTAELLLRILISTSLKTLSVHTETINLNKKWIVEPLLSLQSSNADGIEMHLLVW